MDHDTFKKGFYLSAAITFVFAVCMLVVVLIVQWIWPGVIPFSTFSFWKAHGTVVEWLKASWILLLWGVGVTIVYSVLTRNDPWENDEAETIFKDHALMSLAAGVGEEIAFRWVFFLTFIIGTQVTNFLFLGLFKWTFLHIAAPVADFTTLGILHDLLYHPAGWFVGSAALLANAKFRDGHKYQGLIGIVNSWFIGMFFFWMLFQYGLLACILIHFLYDLFIHGVRYLDMVIERRFER